MTWLILGIVIFLGVHSVSIFAITWRDAMAARLGHAWRALYSLFSIIGFMLIVYGYGLARLNPTVLYTPPIGFHYASSVLMIFVFPLIFATYLPGKIQSAMKHPMLVATKTWAFAHLLSNGTVADVLLFGGFLAWAVADRISMKRRQPRKIPSLPSNSYNDIIAITLGLIMFAAFLHVLHTRLIGMPIILPR